MKILGKDPADNSVRIRLETDDDTWHLYNVLEVGDLVTASTTRREEKANDKIRAEKMEKKRMTLGIRVEKIEFSDDDMRIKVLGTIETGPQDIGQHHTLFVELGDTMSIAKRHWKETQLERLERAVQDSAKPKIVFVSLDQDEATVAVMRQYGLKEITTIRSQRSGKQYDVKESAGDYHGEIIDKIKPMVTQETPLVLLGPGFEKELLSADGKQREPVLFKNSYVYHTGQSGMQGINELLKKGMGSDLLRQSRVGIEMEAVERLMEEIGKDGLATYGTQQVSDAAAAGAVETLLILDSKLRAGDFDKMVADTESQKGKVIVVSEEHDAGKQLGALGGFAAILRYRVS
jgi:protein pelota